MAYVEINLTEEVTNDQKERLIEGINDLLDSVLSKKSYTTHITIRDVDTANWGVSGKPLKLSEGE